MTLGRERRERPLITVVHESDVVLTGLDFRAGAIGWIGGGALGWTDDVGLDLIDE